MGEDMFVPAHLTRTGSLGVGAVLRTVATSVTTGSQHLVRIVGTAVSIVGLAAIAPAGAVALATSEVAPTIVVAPGGSDSAAGTLASPFATIQKAVAQAVAGDVIAVRGGTYTLTTNITIAKSGTAAKPITLTSYGDERVVIDGENLPASHTPVGGSIPAAQRGAIHLTASFWRLIGLEITRGPYAIYCAACNDNVFERLVTQNNYESGFQLQGASSRNLILNLDSYLNHDPRKNGESADGLAIKEGSGNGNVVRGARLWNNVDDGLDLWLFTSPVTIQDSISYGNGVNRWNFPDFAGDGNGFKLGGGNPAPAVNHVVSNSMAVSNAATGFTDNGQSGRLEISHSTAYRNAGTGFDVDNAAAVLTANLAALNGKPVALGARSTGTNNSWDLGGTWNDAAFVSTDAATVTGHRTSAGSIPSSTFLVPRSGQAIGARL
jgi:hypothetical protein